jgi:maltose/maltodextrin transport system substrate-binding protein/arabinogalactan oligomer/maltooligosaccharide transport system substrate-binding protein
MKRVVVLVLGVLLLAGIAATASVAGKLLIWADDTRTPIMQEVAAQFTAAYGVEVEIQQVGFSDMPGQLLTAGPAGEGPDILIGPHDKLGELIQNGLLEPIVLPTAVIGEFNPSAISAFSWGGLLYGVPYAIENVALIYNKTLLPVLPSTFEGLLTLAKGLTDIEAGTYGLLIQEPDPFHTFALHSAGGGYIFGFDANGVLNPCDVGLDNAGSIAGAKLLDQMVKDGIEVAGADYGLVTGLFGQGKLAAMIGGPWTLSDVQKAGINYGVAAIPTIGGNVPKVFSGVQAFEISYYSKNKVLANLFVKDFLITKPVMLRLFELGNRPPCYLPALADLSGNADIQGFAAAGGNSIPMPNIPQMNSVWGPWSDALALIVNQQLDPETAMKNAATQIRTTLGCP